MKRVRKTVLPGILLALICSIVFVGCSAVQSMFGGAESPRPKEYQVSASKDIVNTNVPVVIGAQTNKQDNIKLLAEKAVDAIKASTTKEQVEGIANVMANACSAIQLADGSAGMVSNLMGKSTGDILKMPVSEYLFYAAGQNVVASRNQQTAYEGLRIGWQWTTANITKIAGAAAGGVGLLSFALTAFSKSKNRGKLLVASGEALKEFAQEEPEAWEHKLKPKLTSKHSQVSINAKKELKV